MGSMMYTSVHSSHFLNACILSTLSITGIPLRIDLSRGSNSDAFLMSKIEFVLFGYGGDIY